MNGCAATATLQGRLWKPAPPSTADITEALQLLEGAMKTLRVVGEDQSMGGPTDLEGDWEWGGSRETAFCAFLPSPQRSVDSLGTERCRRYPRSPRPLASALSPPQGAGSPPPCGVSGVVCPRPRVAPLPGRTLPAYLVAFSGGIQVEMSVSPSFVWRGNQGNGSFINVSAAHPPREVPLVWHLLSPGRAKHP